MARIVSKGFSEKILVLEKSGLTVPKRPKIAQNGPKMVVNQKFLENGSNDFPDFWPEVGGQYSKKVDPGGFFPKNPVLENSGPTTRFGTEKLNFFKHRHVTPRWKS